MGALKFEITVTTTYRFLERYARLSAANKFVFSLCQYALELCLIEVSMNKYMPDTLACAALYFSMKLTSP